MKTWYDAAADFHNDVLTWHTNSSEIDTGKMGAAHVSPNKDGGTSAGDNTNIICDNTEAGGGVWVDGTSTGYKGDVAN